MSKKNNITLYNAISNIDEDIIETSLNYKPKNKLIVWSGIAACICAIAVIFGVLNNKPNERKNNSNITPTANVSTSSKAGDNFSIYAIPKSLSENDSNENYEKIILSPVKTLLDKNCGIQKVYGTHKFKSDGTYYDERDKSYKGKIIEEKLFNIKPHRIEFSVIGNNIEYYNVQVDKNVICYNIIHYSSTTGNNDIGYEKNINSLKADKCGFVIWQPTCDKFSKEVLSLTGKPETDYYSNRKDKVIESDAIKKVYDNIKNFNYYFGDTIWFELHYKNGSTETVSVNISLDSKGKYILNYTVK